MIEVQKTVPDSLHHTCVVATWPNMTNGAGSAGDPMTGLVEGTLTLRDALRALLAVNTGDATGLEGSTMEFMSNDGTKVRVRATYSNGVRTLTLLDVS